MDRHQHVKDLADRPLLHASVLDQGGLRGDMQGKGPVQFLCHFLEMDARREQGQQDEQDPDA